MRIKNIITRLIRKASPMMDEEIDIGDLDSFHLVTDVLDVLLEKADINLDSIKEDGSSNKQANINKSNLTMDAKNSNMSFNNATTKPQISFKDKVNNDLEVHHIYN